MLHSSNERVSVTAEAHIGLVKQRNFPEASAGHKCLLH